MPISFEPDVVKPLIFQPMKSIRWNSLSLKVSNVNTISRLQIYRDENIRVSGKNSVPLGRFLLGKSFVLVRSLYCPTFVPVWRLYQSDVCTSLTFVLVRRLSGPTFVLSEVCTARRLYCPTFVLEPFHQIKDLNGTVVNQALSFLHGGSLEITLTIPLL